MIMFGRPDIHCNNRISLVYFSERMICEMVCHLCFHSLCGHMWVVLARVQFFYPWFLFPAMPSITTGIQYIILRLNLNYSDI